MKTKILNLILTLAWFAGTHAASAQGSAFTYQGRLSSGGAAANGSYDLQFTLYGTNVTGIAVAGPVTNTAVAVTNGLFTTLVAFEPGVFTGGSNWLELAVSTNAANAFSTLAPRQQLTPVPYAITAENVSGAVLASSISGVLTNGNLPASPTVTGTVTAGSFAGNGANVTNVNAAALNGLNATNFWQSGGNNVAAGQFLGSTNNQPVEIWANGTRALRLEPNATAPNVIGGSVANSDSGTPEVVGGTIGGGLYNTNASSYAFIGGGSQNLIQTNAGYGVIGGGNGNTIQYIAYFCMIGGGALNTIQNYGEFCMIGGGAQNTILTSSDESAIVGGAENLIQTCNASTIGGGYGNTIQRLADNSVIGGGYSNNVSGYGGFIGGGGTDGVNIEGNMNAGNAAAIVGGLENVINDGGDYSFIGGGDGNLIQTNAGYAMIGSGFQNQIFSDDNCSVIGGGYQNTIQTNAFASVIGGGSGNMIQPNAFYSAIGGGYNNAVYGYGGFIGGGGSDGSSYAGNFNAGNAAAVVGGLENVVNYGADYSFIGGGDQNQSDNYFATVGGGYENYASGPGAFIGGGGYDGGGYAGNTASAGATVVAGGYGNVAEDLYAAVGGGIYDGASGYAATVPGGSLNLAAGAYSFAAGQQARANHQGDFVWADSQNAQFNSTANDQFLIRAQGGVGLGATNLVGGAALTIRYPLGVPTNSMPGPDNGIGIGQYGVFGYKWIQTYGGSLTLNPLGNYVGINTTNPAHLFQVGNAYCDGSAWYPASDRNLKSGFSPVDAAEILAKVTSLPITRWHYTNDVGTVHVGPMAQDFHAAFATGPDDRHIADVDEGGVALAAIQGLNAKLNEKDAKINDLEHRLNQLEQTLQSLTTKK
jgi:hypothetical protein